MILLYKTNISFLVWSLTGIISAIVGFYYRKELFKQHLKDSDEFIRRSASVTVNLKTIDIKHKKWQVEEKIETRRNHYEFVWVDKYESKLTIPITYNHLQLTYKTTLPYDGEWLGIKLYMQNETTAFIDLTAIEKCIINFEFLEKSNLIYYPLYLADKKEISTKNSTNTPIKSIDS